MIKKKIFYESQINSLKGIAILLLIFFHLDINLFNAGFVGIDIFFVISGYLITKIIKNDYHLKKFNLISFYIKRIKPYQLNQWWLVNQHRNFPWPIQYLP